MPLVKKFEDLRIWKEARVLVKLIYQDFRKGTPGHHDYGFKDQIQRAGISIMNNTAEGFERKSSADSARMFDIAKGSCGEVRSMYYAAEDLEYINPEIAHNRRKKAEKISKGIAAYTNTLRSKTT
jgi:four helix bundle protein